MQHSIPNSLRLPFRRAFRLAGLAWLAASAAAAAAAPGDRLVAPSDFLGHEVGADRRLAPWPRVLEYLTLVDRASDRVTIESAGSSTQGRDMPVVVVTSAANQGRLDRYREIARRLADPRGLDPAAVESLVDEGKAIVLVSCSIHSTEVGSTQMAMELVWELATSQEPRIRRTLEEVILLLMPSINPDGQAMVVDWYDKHLGTEFEGGPMPWLYQVYTGHDNNRDFFMLTQKETRAVNGVLYHRWFPQVFLDEHQMGSTGPRMFVPPQADPLAAEIDSLIFRQADLLGTAMSFRLEEAGKTGVGHDMIFDSYWPGGTRNTAWWKGVVGLLTEVASARIASPLWIEPGELAGGEKGLPDYVRRSNFPSPWPGGWWRLRDIVEYELVATKALLETVASHRAEFLRHRARMASTQVRKGGAEPPYGWVIDAPGSQRDPVAAAKLVDLLQRHGVETRRVEADAVVGDRLVRAGATVIDAAQPYRAFLLSMLRPQRYPEVRAAVDSGILPPYDVTSWSLPIAFGVEAHELAHPAAPEWIATRSRVSAQPPWPGGAVAEAPAGGGYRVAAAHDSAAILVNRRLRDGRPVLRLAAGPEAGDFWIPATAWSAAEASAASRELHLPIEPGPSPGAVWRMTPRRVALYKPWVASMDEGWTRFLLENYEFAHRSVTNEELRAPRPAPRGRSAPSGVGFEFDVLLVPDIEATVIEHGDTAGGKASAYPAPYAGGLGKEGAERIRRWVVEEGGTVVALDSSAQFFIDLLGLPVEDVLAKATPEEFLAPGTTVRLLVDTRHPLGWGLAPREAAYFADSPAFATRLPRGGIDRRIVARYPDEARDVLVSGFLAGADRLARRAALVDLEVGKGRVILLGFRAQHRAQPLRTFKFLWNALWRAGLEIPAGVALGGTVPPPAGSQ